MALQVEYEITETITTKVSVDLETYITSGGKTQGEIMTETAELLNRIISDPRSYLIDLVGEEMVAIDKSIKVENVKIV